MVETHTNHWKVGLFVVVGIGAGVLGLFWAGVQRLNRPRVQRVTYFDESVQGLDVGAPVKMRGVTIGDVRDITITTHADRWLVKVTAEVYVDLWVRLGLGTETELRSQTTARPPDLRIQLATTGITGVKFLLVDFFPNAGPPPVPEGELPYNFIPSTPSTLKSLEDSFTVVASLLPETLQRIEDLVITLDERIGAIDTVELSRQIGELLAHADAFVVRADDALGAVDLVQLDADARAFIEELRGSVASADALLERLEAPDGPIQRITGGFTTMSADASELFAAVDATFEGADLEGTARSIRGLAESTGDLSVDGRATLALLRETLVSIQALASMLERNPGALLRGHAAEYPPSIRK